MYCMHQSVCEKLRRDLSRYNLDDSRRITCDHCVFRMMVTMMKERGEIMPTEASQSFSKAREVREARIVIKKLKPMGRRYA